MSEVRSSSSWPGERPILPRVFYISVRHMPMGHTFTLPVMARTIEEAKQKAVEWDNYSYRTPGAYEYLTLA